MIKTWALVKQGEIYNMAAGDDSYASLVTPNFDFVIDVTNLQPKPFISDFYDPNTQTFSQNTNVIEGYGYKTTNVATPNFAPFVVSSSSGSLTVSPAAPLMTIGCMTYDPSYLRDFVMGILSTLDPNDTAHIYEVPYGNPTKFWPFAVGDLQQIVLALGGSIDPQQIAMILGNI